jgi:hypothetical protein
MHLFGCTIVIYYDALTYEFLKNFFSTETNATRTRVNITLYVPCLFIYPLLLS